MIAEEYRKSGKITKEVRAIVKARVRPGMGYLDTCQLVEKEIGSRGGSPAFPTGIGVDHVTAHYAPQADDRSLFDESQVIKVDFGVHVNGFITDTAVTVTFNPDRRLLLDAAEREEPAPLAAAVAET